MAAADSLTNTGRSSFGNCTSCQKLGRVASSGRVAGVFAFLPKNPCQLARRFVICGNIGASLVWLMGCSCRNLATKEETLLYHFFVILSSCPKRCRFFFRFRLSGFIRTRFLVCSTKRCISYVKSCPPVRGLRLTSNIGERP